MTWRHVTMRGLSWFLWGGHGRILVGLRTHKRHSIFHIFSSPKSYWVSILDIWRKLLFHNAAALYRVLFHPREKRDINWLWWRPYVRIINWCLEVLWNIAQCQCFKILLRFEALWNTWSETSFRQDLFPSYLFSRRQFHAIVIFRLESISDLDSGSLPRFFGEFIYIKLKIVVS